MPTKRVLLLSESECRRHEWARWLETSVEICSLDQKPPADELESDQLTEDGEPRRGSPALPDVVVTDLFTIETLDERVRRSLMCGEVGMVAIGTRGPADVSLPDDCTKRELRLAVQLLAEIVRLRRERREEERSLRVLKRLAFFDPLTKLPNRRAWDQELVVRLQSSQQDAENPSVCIALLDLDLFKRVNDRFGHVGGDRVLREVARRLAAEVQRPDLVARLGGDEFALMINAATDQDMMPVIDKIRQKIEHAFTSENQSITLTASAGFAVVDRNGSPDQAVSAADRSLREAKATGRNRTVGQRQ